MTRILTLLSLTLLAGCMANQSVKPDDSAWAPVEPMTPPPQAVASGSIFQAGSGLVLYADQRARQVGDTVTVNLVERTDASKQSSTSSAKDTSISLPTGTFLGSPLDFNTSVNGKQGFDGKGESSQSNRLSGSITVTVHEVLPNGNLRVRGEKWMTLNQGEEFIRVAGMIRPRDIGPDNSVPSFRLADARITYSGKGTLADANQIGWLARFFQIISPL